jgi:excisionase family DNA binding protein
VALSSTVMGREYVEVGEEALGLLRVPEVAKRLAVSEVTVWRLIYSGELKSVKIGRARRIVPDDIAAYVAGLRERRR